jgi:hypothetical protein
MLTKILQVLALSCRHGRITQPFAAAAPARMAAGAEWETLSSTGAAHYVVCLDCGRKFAYDWSQMRVVR